MYILNESQIETLYSVPVLSDDEREELFYLNDLEREQILPRESLIIQIYYILLLGYFKANPTRIDVTIESSSSDFRYIKDKYYPSKNIELVKLTANQKYKIYTKIFKVVDIGKYDGEVERNLANSIRNVAKVHYDLLSIFDEAIDWLRVNKIEIPSYRKL